MKDSTAGVGRIKFFHNSKAVSCLGCQRRKRKCSRESPACGYCKTHGQVCVYEKSENPTPFISNSMKQRNERKARGLKTSLDSSRSDSDTLIASILIDVAQGKALSNLSTQDAVSHTILEQNFEKSKSPEAGHLPLNDRTQHQKIGDEQVEKSQTTLTKSKIENESHHGYLKQNQMLVTNYGSSTTASARVKHSKPNTKEKLGVIEDTKGSSLAVLGYDSLKVDSQTMQHNQLGRKGHKNFFNEYSSQVPVSQLITHTDFQSTSLNPSHQSQNLPISGLSVTQKSDETVPKPSSLLGKQTPRTRIDKMIHTPIESLVGAEIHPPEKSLWPRCISTVDPKSVTPAARVGPVTTKIFNNSLNQHSDFLDKDLGQLISFMPKKDAADALFARYHNSVHSIIPVFDWEAICPIYERYWDEEKSADLSFFTQIFAIFYAASVSLYEEAAFKKDGNIDFYIEQMKFYMGASEIALSMSWFPRKVSIVGLQAAVVLHGVVRNDCRTDDCGSVGNLIRLAQLLELNRDPVNYHEISNPIEVQMRRILWWEILYLDTTTSLSTKIPPIIVQDEYDTLLPNEYYRGYNGSYKLDQPIAFSNGRFRWAECCNRILRKSFLFKAASQADLDGLKRMIDDFAIQCSFSIEKITTSSNIKQSQESFVRFSSSVISTLADRCYILFNIVFQDELHRTSSQLEVEGAECFETILKKLKVLPDTSSVAKDTIVDNPQLIDNQIHLLHEFTKHGTMPTYIQFLWELRKFQPIQTVLSLMRNLIVELRLCKSSGTSRKEMKGLIADKRVKCVDETLEHLSYLSELTTPLCKERWQLLRDLQKKIHELISSFDTFQSHAYLASTPSDNVFSEFDNKSSADSDYDHWDSFDQELYDFQKIVEENMNIKIWDDASGHFVL